MIFESKEKKTRELVQKELREIDWNDVDAYPIFEFCDETKSKLEQRKCFEKGLLEHFSKTLNEFEYIFKPGINPTIIVDFLIEKDGRISIINIKKDTAINASGICYSCRACKNST